MLLGTHALGACILPKQRGARRRPSHRISAASSIEFGCFTVIIDDIINPDGRSLMGAMGGGGPQTLYGYQLATSQRGVVALAAGIGQDDFPDHCRAWLAQMDCSEVALQRIAGARTPRAWQLIEEDGRRTQVWRTPANPALYGMLRPAFDSLPPAFQAARGTALGINPSSPSLELMRALKQAASAAGGLAAAETFCPATKPLSGDALHALVSACDVFSVNQLEAASMLGRESDDSPRDMLMALLGMLCVVVCCHHCSIP